MDQHPSLTLHQFLNFRRQQTYFLHLYRYGQAHQFPQLEPTRVWEHISVPKPGYWMGHRLSNPMVGNEYPPDKFFSQYKKDDKGATGSKPSLEMQQDFIDTLPRVIDTEAHLLKFKKVLGWGGLGLAALYMVQDKRRRFKRWVVVKYSLPGAADFQGEKDNHLLLARNRHIVQVVSIRGLPREQLQTTTKKTVKKWGMMPKLSTAPKGGINPYDNMQDSGFGRYLFIEKTKGVDEEVLDFSEDTLFIEHMRRGNLGSWICKGVGEKEPKFSDKVLWVMFDCLFRGVVAMAHPASIARKTEYEASGGRYGQWDFEEQVLPHTGWRREKKESDDLIHFDLDPSNILVGDFNLSKDKTHSMIPILKIGDLGLMNKMKEHKKRSAEMMWGTRATGKPFSGWLAPEQFHEEWDYLWNPLPDRETDPRTKPKVAGQYSWRTNVYWIGLNMFCLLTRFYPPKIPIPYWMGVEYITDEKTGKTTRREPWTYAGYLMRPDVIQEYDVDLLKTICYCMADDPMHRPDLKDLDRKIKWKLAQHWPGETDADTRKWAADFFSKPGMPGPEPPRSLFSGLNRFTVPNDSRYGAPPAVAGPSSIFSGTALHANNSSDSELEETHNEFRNSPMGNYPIGPDTPVPDPVSPTTNAMLDALNEILQPPTALRVTNAPGQSIDLLAKLFRNILRLD
ncbi:hypothetical protein QBC38DRAFT_547369 [Podospora fimiseda]|uniref:Protein kinase domain-containing protein n=1 Tax=Podospora fimiseda TaxID=252190 RepID=A0AAN7BK62_9PEZI|nr:hypothetical protein QBC38DRAFT_547369 [Podospora fimiseda]